MNYSNEWIIKVARKAKFYDMLLKKIELEKRRKKGISKRTELKLHLQLWEAMLPPKRTLRRCKKNRNRKDIGAEGLSIHKNECNMEIFSEICSSSKEDRKQIGHLSNILL